MKRLALVAFLFLLSLDAAIGKGGSFSAPSRSSGSSYSAPSRSSSYSAPSRSPSYTAPAKTPSYTAPAKPSTPSYSAPAKPAAPSSPAPSGYAATYNSASNQYVYVQQPQSFGFMHYLLFWQLFNHSNQSQDPPGYQCSGGGCSQRQCTPLPGYQPR